MAWGQGQAGYQVSGKGIGLIKGDPDRDDFFEVNREMRYVDGVMELVADYGVERAGRMMWAVWMVYHPASAIYDMRLEDKCDKVAHNYLEDPDFDWSVLNAVVGIFGSIAMTQEERMYHDAVYLYEISVREALDLPADKKASFIKAIGTAAREIEKLKAAYLASTESQEMTSGEVQSGWGSTKKRG